LEQTVCLEACLELCQLLGSKLFSRLVGIRPNLRDWDALFRPGLSSGRRWGGSRDEGLEAAT
jgi:hypothetical protein